MEAPSVQRHAQDQGEREAGRGLAGYPSEASVSERRAVCVFYGTWAGVFALMTAVRILIML